MSEPHNPVEAADADYLVEQYVAGQLTGDEAGRLLELLRARPEFGRGLLDQLSMDAMLRDLSRPENRESAGAAAPADARTGAGATPLRLRGPRRVRQTTVWAAAACVAVVAVAGLSIWSKSQPGGGGKTAVGPAPTTATAPAVPDEATTAAVAVLTRTVDAVWANPAQAYGPGTPLERGWLRLASGLAEVEFYGGARVVLEGPGALQLVSAGEAYCPGGRLSADVPPPARGFKIVTPRGAVVDLGTAFGLDVTGDGDEVHVFEGEVEVHPSAAAMRGLKQGQAAAVAGDGGLRLFPADAAAFTSATGLERRAAEALLRRQEAWRSAGQRWNADPALAVRFDFEGLRPGDRAMPNRAAAAAPPSSSAAAVVGCGRADGRWPGKGALEFRGVSDRVRLELPGEIASVTFAAWVRVNGLDRRFNSLFMADAFNPGATHWQVLNDGRVRLGVAGPAKRGHADYDSPVVFTPERLGRWAHLAVVYDAGRREVLHYVDGRPVSREATEFNVPLRIGPAEIGNWNPGARADSWPIRHFSGRIDEFAVYRRPLTAAEIERLSAEGAGAATAD